MNDHPVPFNDNFTDPMLEMVIENRLHCFFVLAGRIYFSLGHSQISVCSAQSVAEYNQLCLVIRYDVNLVTCYLPSGN